MIGTPPQTELSLESAHEQPSPVPSIGLGLPYVKKLVEILEGKIELRSSLGQGTEAILVFPYRPGQSAERVSHIGGQVKPPIAAPSQHIPGSQATSPKEQVGPRHRILIAEDQAELRGYLARQLQLEYEVAVAKDGQEAWELLPRFSPALILSDVMMPRKDGVALLREVKNSEAFNHTPVILLTARSEEPHLLHGLSQGADDYVSKPFSLAILKLKIRNLLDLRQALIDRFRNSYDLEPRLFTANTQEENFLRRVFDLLEAHLDDDALNVDFLASEMAMSRTLLFNKIKALTGDSPKSLIMSYKVKRAVSLLQSGRYTVSEVSDLVGYADPNYFTKAFKRYAGQPPSAFLVKA